MIILYQNGMRMGKTNNKAFMVAVLLAFAAASAYLVVAAEAAIPFTPVLFAVNVTTTLTVSTTSTTTSLSTTTTTLNTTSTTTTTTSTLNTTSTTSTVTTTINPCEDQNGNGRDNVTAKCSRPGEHEGHDDCCTPEDHETHRGFWEHHPFDF